MTSCRVVTMCFSILSCFLLTTPSTAAAVIKSRLKQTGSYDQKQTGQYNIRLHLKDFQIIALLNEDALGALNDDYEDLDYQIPEEYLDVPFPITQNLTSTVSTSTVSSSSTPQTTKTTQLSTTPTSTVLPPRRTVTSRVTTRKQQISTKAPPLTTTSSSLIITNHAVTQVNGVDVKNSSATPIRDADNGRIPVVIMQDKSNRNANDKTKKIISTSVTILPPNSGSSGSVGSASQVILGEILHYKKCPDGYSRDKIGLCRKTRRPQLPFDISRFTSNLAARFKRPSSTEKHEK